MDRSTELSLRSVPIMNLAVISIGTLHVIASFTLMTTKYVRVTSKDKVFLLLASVMKLAKTPAKQMLSQSTLTSKLTREVRHCAI
jgi:hypothetical protein